MKLSILLLVMLGVAMQSFCGLASNKNKKPNILLIVSDDQGYADFGAYSGLRDVKTPHLDDLTKSGVRFSEAYVTASICSPSRCAILTGRYQQRWGVYGYKSSLPSEEITLAEQLRDAGYATGLVGKSHYGNHNRNTNSQEFPLNHGFQYFFGKEGGTMDYLRHKNEDYEFYSQADAKKLGVGPFWENKELVEMDGYSTDILINKATSFIEKNSQNPFFLMVSLNEVHLFTHQLPDTTLNRLGIEKVPDWNPKEQQFEDYLDWYVKTVKPNTPEGRKRYLWHLQQLDNGIGKLIDKLKEEEIKEETLIIYISDNGGSPRTYASNHPLKGNKYILEEGGIRVPFVISWPGMLPQNETYDKMVSSLDILLTIMELTDSKVPADYQQDGVSLVPFITNGENTKEPHDMLYWTGRKLKMKAPIFDDPSSSKAKLYKSFNGDYSGWAIRRKKWKLRYLGQSDQYALYNLEDDMGETTNLAEKQPDLVKELTEEFFKWHSSIDQ